MVNFTVLENVLQIFNGAKNYLISCSDMDFLTYDNRKVFCSRLTAAMVPIIRINIAFWLNYNPLSGRDQPSGIGKAVNCP